MKNKITLTLEIPKDSEMTSQEVMKELSMIEFALNQTHSKLSLGLHLSDKDLDEVGETLKIKRIHPDAIIPTRAYKTSLGYDLYAIEDKYLGFEDRFKLNTGISIEFPKGFGGMIKCRSSLAKCGMSIEAGVIDEDYRGEIIVMASFHKTSSKSEFNIKKGDKIAQLLLVPTPKFEIEEIEELSETDRGERGFGSSGK